MPTRPDLVSHLTHPLLPPRLAFLSFIGLVPLGLALTTINSIARLDVEAKALGFASAGHMARARDLGLASPKALAVHDEATHRKSNEQRCSAVPRIPLDCHPPAHRTAALTYVRSMLDQGAYEQIVREALTHQRTALLAGDKSCTALLDRIDEDAAPYLVANKAAGFELAAGIWARNLSFDELQKLTERGKPGATFMRTGENDALEQKVAGLNRKLDREFDTALQAWAMRLVSEDVSWRSLFGGRSLMGNCKSALTIASQ